MSVTRRGENHDEPWSETTFREQLLAFKWLPANTGDVDRDINMQALIPHPGGWDVRGPTRLINAITNLVQASVVISRAFFFSPCNHSVILNIIIFFFRRSKRQRNFSLFYFAS